MTKIIATRRVEGGVTYQIEFADGSRQPWTKGTLTEAERTRLEVAHTADQINTRLTDIENTLERIEARQFTIIRNTLLA